MGTADDGDFRDTAAYCQEARHEVSKVPVTPQSAVDHRRSPRYPAISLPAAINGAHLLATKNEMAPVDGEALADALGYKSLSGPARTLIGAMRQYGLLQKERSGTRLSDSARLIIRGPEGCEEQAIAIRKAALTPRLFRDLYATHRGEPESAIKSYLIIRRGFTELGAALVASSYRDTLSFAKLTTHETTPSNKPESARNSRAAATGTRSKRDDELLTQTLEISIPRNFKVDVIIRGDQIRKDDIARIRNQFDRWIQGLEEAFE